MTTRPTPDQILLTSLFPGERTLVEEMRKEFPGLTVKEARELASARSEARMRGLTLTDHEALRQKASRDAGCRQVEAELRLHNRTASSGGTGYNDKGM